MITDDSPRFRALVTGGSGHLGTAICRQLIADGAHVHRPCKPPSVSC